MAIELNHTIVAARDKLASAMFLTDLLGLPAPAPFGPFLVVTLTNGVSLDFVDSADDIRPQHYAFLVSEAEFEKIPELIPRQAAAKATAVVRAASALSRL
jgi:hypothetical protein